MPADTNPLSLLPFGNTCTQFIDDASHFVSWHARILNARPPFFCEHVAVTDSARLYLDAYVPLQRLRNFTLNELEIPSRFLNLRHLHQRDRGFCSTHIASYKSWVNYQT